MRTIREVMQAELADPRSTQPSLRETLADDDARLLSAYDSRVRSDAREEQIVDVAGALWVRAQSMLAGAPRTAGLHMFHLVCEHGGINPDILERVLRNRHPEDQR